MRIKQVFASEIAALDSNVYTGGGTDDTAALQAVLDVAAVFGGAYFLGFPLLTGIWYKVGFILYMVAAFGLFTLESWVYHKIKQ